MSGPIYDNDLVVHLLKVDDDAPVDVEMIATRSGPAGEAIIQLSDGVLVSVDYAQPDLLTAISLVPSRSTPTDRPLAGDERQLLGDLIGEERADQLGRMMMTGSDRPQRMPGSGTRRQNWSLGPEPTEEAVHLGQLASLTSIATDHDEESSVRIVAALEGATLISTFGSDRIRLSGEKQMATAVTDVMGTRRSVSLPKDIADDLQAVMNTYPVLAMQIDMIAGRVAAMTPSRVTRLAELIVSTMRPKAEEPVLRSTVEPVFHRMLSESLAFKSVTSIRDTEQPLMIDSVGASRLELLWEADPQGSWVRIMNPDDLSLVAMVPVRRVDGQWVAEAIVPPDRPLNTWVIEVTDAPLGARSQTTTERIIEAVRMGQLAARLSLNIGQPDHEAQDAWLICAAAWQELGDEFRANKARNFAQGEQVTRKLLLADQVRTALGLDGI